MASVEGLLKVNGSHYAINVIIKRKKIITLQNYKNDMVEANNQNNKIKEMRENE
ncbi:MAG: hypothetical protein ACFFDF_01050 [Candidatus Odinarchaeota archaeon]